MPKSLLLLSLLLVQFVSFAPPVQVPYTPSIPAAEAQWVDSVFTSLSVDEKIGQLFMPIVESRNDWKPRIAGYIQNIM